MDISLSDANQTVFFTGGMQFQRSMCHAICRRELDKVSGMSDAVVPQEANNWQATVATVSGLNTTENKNRLLGT